MFDLLQPAEFQACSRLLLKMRDYAKYAFGLTVVRHRRRRQFIVVVVSFSFLLFGLIAPVKHLAKDGSLTLPHLFGTICLKHSATLILPPL